MTNPQTQMPMYHGMAPGLDTQGRIDKIATTAKFITKAANYTVKTEESGAIFTATAAATFTLPAVADSTGCIFTFVNAANTDMAVTAPSGTLVADGNATATTITFSTTSHKIGGQVMLACDGTKYYMLATGNLSAIGTIS